jgi:hypothetical protein
MRLALVLAAYAIGATACSRMDADPPPRHYMQGGVWFPAATGYWFHQYAESEEIERLMVDLGFACRDAAGADGPRVRCERRFALPGGLFARADFAEFAFRRNGAVALAESGCSFSFLAAASLSGTCTTYSARGAVYPTIETFAAMSEAMLRPLPLQQQVSVFRLPMSSIRALRDAEAAVEQLQRWRFECDEVRQKQSVTFRGNAGEVAEATCRQWSLRTPGVLPQEQQVVIRYDTKDLAVLGITARLDGTSSALSPTLHTPRDPSTRGAETARAPGAPTSLTLETLSGERFEMPYSAIGTGSRQQTLEGFSTLTPESQRALVQAYIDKQGRQWSGKFDRLSRAYLGSLDWYGPEAMPHIEALMSDDAPDVGAALLKYVCLEVPMRAERPFDEIRAAHRMGECIDGRRATMPRSIEAMDALLAEDLRVLTATDARALDAFLDFRRDVLYVHALGRDGKASGAALEETVAAKELRPELAGLVSAALAQRDRPAR